MIRSILLYLFISHLLLAQSQLKEITQPQLKVIPSSWDFGKISDDKVVTHTFVIKNNGQKPLQLKNLPADCNCVAYLPKPSVIEPGKKAKVFVRFDPKGRFGDYRWEVQLQTNWPQFPKIIIPMSAHILRKSHLSLDKIKLGVFKRHINRSVDLWFTCYEKPNFKLLSAMAPKDKYNVKVQEVATIRGFYPGPQRGYKITISAKNDIPYGRHHDLLRLVTDIPKHPTMEVGIWGYVIGDLTTVPDYISFGVMAPGVKKSKKITIYHNKFQPFKISKLECDLPITTKVKIAIPDKYYYITVEIQTPQKPGEFRGQLKIHTTCPTHKIAPVYLQGIVKKDNKP